MKRCFGVYGGSRSVFPLLLLGAIAFAFLVKYPNIAHRPILSHDEDATAHVLLSMRAMREAGVKTSKLLPIFTMSQSPGSRGVDNFQSASIHDENGNYYYVSFPPLSFSAPYLLFSSLHLDINEENMRYFSVALGAVLAFSIYLLVIELSHESGSKNAPLIGFAAATLFTFSSENLWIFGNIYWSYIPYALFLILTLVFVARYLRKKDPTSLTFSAVFACLACLFEWSGFTLAGGISVAGMILLFRGEKIGLWLLLCGIAAVSLAATIILLQSSQVAGLGPYLQALARRPAGHIATYHDIPLFSFLFVVIFGPVMAFICGFVFLGGGRLHPGPPDWRRRNLVVLWCASAACCEAILLIHHFMWYPYGAISLFVLLVVLAAFLMLEATINVRRLALMLAGYVAVSIGVYLLQNPYSLRNTEFARQFDVFNRIRDFTSLDEAVFVNFQWPLGVGIWRSQRNLIGSNLVSFADGSYADLSSSEATGLFPYKLNDLLEFMKRNMHARKGAVVILSAPRPNDSILVWWPYTKKVILSKYLASGKTLGFGELSYILRFDERGPSGLLISDEIWSDSNSARPRGDAHDWEAKALFDNVLGVDHVDCRGVRRLGTMVQCDLR